MSGWKMSGEMSFNPPKSPVIIVYDISLILFPVNICENYDPGFYNNDTYLGVFPCPMEKDPDDFKYCCGEARYQYCCKLIDK